MARYEVAVAGYVEAGRIGRERTRPGSASALIAAFYTSPQYRALAGSTRQTYRNVLERFRAQHGAKRIVHLERRHIMEIIAAKADTPGAANFLLRMIRQLLDHAIEFDWRPDSPARQVKPYRMPEGGFHSWAEDEIERFYSVHPPGSMAHIAMNLMLFTGAARSDAVKLGWGNIQGDRLVYRRTKTRKQSDVVVNIPIHPELVAVLDALPRDAFTFLQTRSGKSRLADAGATPHEIQAVTGHKTLKEVERYTAAASRAGLAKTGFEKRAEWSKREQVVANHSKRFAKSEAK